MWFGGVSAAQSRLCMSSFSKVRGLLSHVQPRGEATMSAPETVAELQAQLRNLRRQARTWRPGRGTILEPTTPVKLTTVVIYSLCQDAPLACVWAQRKQDARRRHDGLWPITVTPLLVQTWHTAYGQHPRVAAALASFADDLRKTADEFLMESLLAEEVEEQNRKGLTMCPRLLFESFVRKWRLRPRCPATERWLCQLQEDVNMQASWRRSFKRRWGLEWHNLPGAKCLGTAEIKARSEAYLRWIRWMLQEEQGSEDCVVVNMDETMLANVTDHHKGIVVNRRRKKDLDHATQARRRAYPRCSLLGCIANDHELQKHMPQVFLPKSDADKQPPQNIRDVFSSAEAPIEAWHGTSGFLSAAGAASFLTRLRNLIRRHRPHAKIIVVWDASMAHTNEKVLRHARRLGIRVVLVPGRLTWLLQPLDVYVYSCLKRELRYVLARDRMRDAQAKLSVAQQLRCCTEAVQTVMVRKSWDGMMRKCGISVSGEGLNDKLAGIVRGSDLTPRPPSREEVQGFIGCSADRAVKVHSLLVDHLTQPARNVAEVGRTCPHSALQSNASTDMSVLRPVLEHVERPASREEAGRGGNLEAMGRQIPRGRRLTPVPRNLMFRTLPSHPHEARMATRSQRPRLVPGVLETESQPRSGRPGSAGD